MLPDTARVWVFPTSAPVSSAQQDQLLKALQTFFGVWQSHGRPARGAAAIIESRFLVVAGVLQNGGDLSGCSIDSLTHAIESAVADKGLTLLSPLMVFYRTPDGAVNTASRGAFRRLVRSEAIHDDTPVFDVGISSLGALRGGAFELPFQSSWHARVFRPHAAGVQP